MTATRRKTERRPAAGLRLTAGLALLGVLALGIGLSVGMSPLLPATAVLALAVSLALLPHPHTAVTVAVVVALLPDGLLPLPLQRLAEAATLGVVLAALLIRDRRGPRPLVAGPALLLLGAFLLWALLSTTWSAAPADSLAQLRPYVLTYGLLFLIVNTVRRREDLATLMDGLALAGAVLLLAAVVSVVQDGWAPGDRLDVLNMNGNQVGNLLVLTTIGVLWRQVTGARTTRGRGGQTLSFLALALLVILLTGSRGSLLAFGLLMLGLAVTRPLRPWAVGGLAAGCLLLLAVPSVFSTVVERTTEGSQDQLSRTELWAAGLTLVADHPFGVGLGQAPHLMPAYVNARVSEDYFKAKDLVPAHNPFIEVASDTGVPGVTLFALAVVAAAVTGLRAVVRGRQTKDAFLRRYGAVVVPGSIAFLAVWIKSGGESYHVTTGLMLALWILPAHLHARRSPGQVRAA